MGNTPSAESPVSDWEKRPAKDLVGMCAMRAGPTVYGDYSYEVTPHGHIFCTYSLFKFGDHTNTKIFDPRWNDDKWVKAPDSLCDHIKGFNETWRTLISLQQQLQSEKEQNDENIN